MNRGMALLSVAALFLSGIAIGALGLQVYQGHRAGGPPGGPPPPPVFVEQLDAALHLTLDQKRQVGRILEESRQASEAIRREVKPRLDRQIEETRQKIDAALTPEQREKFAELRREQRARAERFFLGEGPPRPWLGPPPGPGGRPPGGPLPGGPPGDGPPPEGPPPGP